jgi:hypothetical protein
VSPAELETERRRGRLAAVAAVVGAVSLYVSVAWSQSVYPDAPDNKADKLRYFDRHASDIIGAAAVQTLAMLMLAVVALHLYRATRARRPDEPLVVAVMGVYGPVLLALVTIVAAVAQVKIAGDFADRSAQTIAAAENALEDPALLVPRYAGISAALALAFWLVKGSLDAMRVGLLTRFMGILGIALGPAFVLQFGSLVLPVWLIALAALFWGYWPRGLPPAWESGEARPWPGSGERPQSAPAAPEPGAAGRNGEVESVGQGVRRRGGRSAG